MLSGDAVRPPKPPLPSPESIPESLRATGWLCWRYTFSEQKNKWAKPPYSARDGSAIGSDEKHREHLVSLAEALEAVEKYGCDGVGRVLDGLVGVDFDDCRSLEDGTVSADVAHLARFLSVTYGEVSPSGTGLHFIGTGKIPRALNVAFGSGRLEVYSGFGRYFTFTGQRYGNSQATGDCQAFLDTVYKKFGCGQEPEAERHPLTVAAIRRIHQQNIDALRSAPHGAGNSTLNQCAFFAAKAFAAGALDGTDQEVKQQLVAVVTKEWQQPHDERGAWSTVNSGWRKGLEEPIEVVEDEFPEVDRTIDELNERFFCVKNFGKKFRICHIEEESRRSGGKSYSLEWQQREDFIHGFENKLIATGVRENGDMKLENKAMVWLRSRHRREYDRVVFMPNSETPKNLYNMWKGFAFEPRRGDCSLYLKHVRDNICAGDEDKFRYVTQWMAYAVQHPDESAHTMLVVQGLKGVGKNVFAECFGELFGPHCFLAESDQRVTGNFNSHLRDKCVLILDEAFFVGDRRHERVMKSLITGGNLTIEAKGVDPVVTPNLLHIIMLGNAEWLVRASIDERRYYMLRCSVEHRQDKAYFTAIMSQMRDGGYAALLHHLLSLDTKSFQSYDAPHTKDLNDQIISSLDGIEHLWFEILYSGEIPGDIDEDDGTAKLRASTLLEFAQRQRRREWQSISIKGITVFLSCVLGLKQPKRVQKDGVKAPRLWNIPSLEECRTRWDKVKTKVDWPDDDSIWTTAFEFHSKARGF